MQQRAEVVGVQRLDLHPHEMTVAVQHVEPRRGRASRSHCADEEHRPRHDQRDEHRDGCVVEQVEVVDQEYQPVVACQPPQFSPGGMEQAGPFVIADTEFVR